MTVTARVDIGLTHRGGEILRYAVLHDLHGSGGETATCILLAPSHQRVDLICDGLAPLEPQCPTHPAGQQAGFISRTIVGARVAALGIVADEGVLPSGDSEAVEIFLPLEHCAQHLLVADWGHHLEYDAHRPFVEGACRFAGGAPLDPAISRIWGVLIDSGKAKRPGVDPGGVAVAAGQEGRATGRDLIKIFSGRRATREGRHAPAATQDPRLSGVARDVRRHRLESGPPLVGGRQIASEQFEATPDRVHVSVNEAGEQHLGVQTDHLCLGADHGAGFIAEGDDHAILHCNCVGVAAGGIGAQHRAVDKG